MPSLTLKNNNDNTQSLIFLTQDLLENHKAKDICIFDAEEKMNYTSYIIVASVTSPLHLKALFGKVSRLYKAHCYQQLVKRKKEINDWIVLDYSDIVIHLISNELRNYYRLDDLFKSLKKPIFLRR